MVSLMGGPEISRPIRSRYLGSDSLAVPFAFVSGSWLLDNAIMFGIIVAGPWKRAGRRSDGRSRAATTARRPWRALTGHDGRLLAASGDQIHCAAPHERDLGRDGSRQDGLGTEWAESVESLKGIGCELRSPFDERSTLGAEQRPSRTS